MVNLQALLLDRLGIEQLFCVIGGSSGRMQCSNGRCVSRTGVRGGLGSPRRAPFVANIAFNEAAARRLWPIRTGARRLPAPEQDADRRARRCAHWRATSPISPIRRCRKFRRRCRAGRAELRFDADFQVESICVTKGSTFVERFDANSYLYITRAMHYSICFGYDGVLGRAFADTSVRFCLFPSPATGCSQKKRRWSGRSTPSRQCQLCEVETDKGQRRFLLDEPEFATTLRGFLDGAGRHRGLAGP